MRFNPPPGWPSPPVGWVPPGGWKPDPAWPAPPDGWQLWLPDNGDAALDGVEASAPLERPTEAEGVSTEPAGDSAAAHAQTSSTAGAWSQSVPETDLDLNGGQDRSGNDRGALLGRIAELEARLATHNDNGVIELDDQRVLQDVGIYRYHHPLENASGYKDRLTDLNAQIDALVKGRHAVLAADMFTFDGSLARGRRMVSDLSRLMLRAYNAEADNCVRSLRSGNITTAKRRLTAAMTAIEKLGSIMEMCISPDYHALRVLELELVADYQMKRQQEKEAAREERELLREQRRVEAELAAERERLDKERAHYLHALEQLRANGDQTAIELLEERLSDIDKAIETNDYRAANIRAGYVYVISNIGAFGPNIVKIGMTRRLEPLDRVRELGDASVPFRYDVHALHFSNDAVTLEAELHRHFADRRVNLVNERREFFFATPAEVRAVLREKAGGYSNTPRLPKRLSTSRASVTGRSMRSREANHATRPTRRRSCQAQQASLQSSRHSRVVSQFQSRCDPCRDVSRTLALRRRRRSRH